MVENFGPSHTRTPHDASFKDFAAGEVLFLDASGLQRSQEDWKITFRFAASPNVTGLAAADLATVPGLGGSVTVGMVGCKRPPAGGNPGRDY